MARLVAVCRANSDYIYERRQVPLEESGGITVRQVGDFTPVISCIQTIEV